MDVLKDKTYITADYTCRYIGVPFYYNTKRKKDICGTYKNLDKNVEFVTHKLVQGDTLDNLALKYYNNPTLWWYIAQFNDILDPFIVLIDRYRIIQIPALTQINFKDAR